VQSYGNICAFSVVAGILILAALIFGIYTQSSAQKHQANKAQ